MLSFTSDSLKISWKLIVLFQHICLLTCRNPGALHSEMGHASSLIDQKTRTKKGAHCQCTRNHLFSGVKPVLRCGVLHLSFVFIDTTSTAPDSLRWWLFCVHLIFFWLLSSSSSSNYPLGEHTPNTCLHTTLVINLNVKSWKTNISMLAFYKCQLRPWPISLHSATWKSILDGCENRLPGIISIMLNQKQLSINSLACCCLI